LILAFVEYNSKGIAITVGAVMHIELKRHSRDHLSKQIAQSLADRIRSGLLQPGMKLPSVRALAGQLNVSLVTVAKGYEELERLGLIHCMQGKGCFVGPEPAAEEPEWEISSDWQLAVVDYLPRANVWRYLKGPESETAYRFHISEIEYGLLPNEEIGANLHRLIRENPSIVAQYGPVQGDAELRRLLVRHFAARGIRAGEEDVLITNGSQQAIDLVARAFVGPGDYVYVEAPAYTGAIDVFASRGAKMIAVPVDRDGLRVNTLLSLCDRFPPKLIYVTPSYQNPTGAAMSAERRSRILDLAQSRNCLVLEDDATSDLYFGKAPPLAIKAMDSHGHVIYVKSFSKVLSPGCRVSAIVSSGTLLSRLVAAKTMTDLGSPLIGQKAILPFFQGDRLEKHLSRLRNAMREKCAVALGILRKHAPEGVTWTDPAGGMNLWVSLPAHADGAELAEMARKAGISILPGAVCYSGEPEHHHFRLSFSFVDTGRLAEGMEKLCLLMHRYLESDRKASSGPVL